MDNKTLQDLPRNDGESYSDSPMYSRLFVVGDKKLMNRESMTEAFSRFGHIEDIKIPLSRKGAPKTVCFIKFSKTSEAADALEAMDMKCLLNTRRPLKVLVATNRSEVEWQDDKEKYKRLFIHVPKTLKEEDVQNLFNTYGRLDSVVIQRDHNTGESKGFAYVTFSKFSEAAHAFEQCERQYRPIFAKPKLQRRPETSFESNIALLAKSSDPNSSRSSDPNSSLVLMMGHHCGSRLRGYTKVNFMCCRQVTSDQMERLFDLIPGMVDYQFHKDNYSKCGKGTVTYSNPTSAAYAVNKLNEFEYPQGMQIFVRPDNSNYDPQDNFRKLPVAVSKLRNAIYSSKKSGGPDLVKLTEAIAEASKLLKLATGDITDDQIPHSKHINYCSVKLPPQQPLADIDSEVVKRCFLVCKPTPPPLTVLRDIFCRFGNLINVYTLPNKTVGFARFSSAKSAEKAIKTLHGAEVCGVRMKVLEAQEETNPKKRRYDEM